jgi:hypothetical protein
MVMVNPSVPGQGLTPFAYEQIADVSSAVKCTAATANPTTEAPAKLALVHVQAQAVRSRPDGTAPTDAIGHPSAVNDILVLPSAQAIENTQFIEQAGGAILNITYYR